MPAPSLSRNHSAHRPSRSRHVLLPKLPALTRHRTTLPEPRWRFVPRGTFHARVFPSYAGDLFHVEHFFVSPHGPLGYGGDDFSTETLSFPTNLSRLYSTLGTARLLHICYRAALRWASAFSSVSSKQGIERPERPGAHPCRRINRGGTLGHFTASRQRPERPGHAWPHIIRTGSPGFL